MALRLYDTMSREVREVFAMDGDSVRFYCCGPTVYGPAHVGNFRTFVLQDVFRRTLETSGLKTYHARNLTDVDDKTCLLYTSPSPRDATLSRMPSSA